MKNKRMIIIIAFVAATLVAVSISAIQKHRSANNAPVETEEMGEMQVFEPKPQEQTKEDEKGNQGTKAGDKTKPVYDSPFADKNIDVGDTVFDDEYLDQHADGDYLMEGQQASIGQHENFFYACQNRVGKSYDSIGAFLQESAEEAHIDMSFDTQYTPDDLLALGKPIKETTALMGDFVFLKDESGNVTMCGVYDGANGMYFLEDGVIKNDMISKHSHDFEFARLFEQIADDNPVAQEAVKMSGYKRAKLTDETHTDVSFLKGHVEDLEWYLSDYIAVYRPGLTQFTFDVFGATQIKDNQYRFTVAFPESISGIDVAYYTDTNTFWIN